jgi:predicted transcriptional regulator
VNTPEKMVVSLREDGFSQYKIADILGVSQSCISRFFRKFNQNGSIENLPRSGRP